MIDGPVFRIKDIRVPHKRYDTQKGVMYDIPVIVSIPDDILAALRGVNERYLERFSEESSFCVNASQSQNGSVSYLITVPEHHVGIRIDDDSGRLYVPSEMSEKSLYILNGLMRVFGVKEKKTKLNKRVLQDVEEAVRDFG